jgi:hypothetical protein
MAAAASAAAVETLEEVEVAGAGGRRRKPRGWKTMPFIIGTYVLFVL